MEKPLQIVIVDDEEICLMSVEIMLMSVPCNLVKFNNGNEALEYIITNSHNIDIVLLDLMLPSISGKEIFERIKGFNNIKIVIQTGMKTSNVPDCAHIIYKPFEKEDLFRVLGFRDELN